MYFLSCANGSLYCRYSYTRESSPQGFLRSQYSFRHTLETHICGPRATTIFDITNTLTSILAFGLLRRNVKNYVQLQPILNYRAIQASNCMLSIVWLST